MVFRQVSMENEAYLYRDMIGTNIVFERNEQDWNKKPSCLFRSFINFASENKIITKNNNEENYYDVPDDGGTDGPRLISRLQCKRLWSQG